jgi:hypothetical protein
MFIHCCLSYQNAVWDSKHGRKARCDQAFTPSASRLFETLKTRRTAVYRAVKGTIYMMSCNESEYLV